MTAWSCSHFNVPSYRARVLKSRWASTSPSATGHCACLRAVYEGRVSVYRRVVEYVSDSLKNLLVVARQLFTAEDAYRHLLGRLLGCAVRVDRYTRPSSLCLLMLARNAVLFADRHRGWFENLSKLWKKCGR